MPDDPQTAALTPGRRDADGKHLLDPIDRFSEILFGLIMVLTFTGSLSVATAGREEVRTMLVGAVGCNLAWGIVDAVMYIIGSVTQRKRNLTLLRALFSARSTSEIRGVLAHALPQAIAEAMTDDELEGLGQRLAQRHEHASHRALKTDDLLAAAAVFAFVFTATLPVIVPFFVMSDAAVALRVSNAIAIVLLFLAGASVGRFSGFGPWRTGAAMVAIGLVLVAVTMALGG